MNDSDQAYESHILKIAINTYLDQELTNSQKDLKRLQLNKDGFVWDIVTSIYQQSGYKVSMSFVRDIIEQRIVNMKAYLIEAEKEARLEMMRAEEKARLEMIRIEAEKVEKQTKVNNFIKNLPQLNFDEKKLDIFIRVYKIIELYVYKIWFEHDLCDDLDEFDPDEIFDQELFIKILKTTIFTDGFSEYDINIIMNLEEEFEIIINDEEAENLKTVRDIVEIIYSKIES